MHFFLVKSCWRGVEGSVCPRFLFLCFFICISVSCGKANRNPCFLDQFRKLATLLFLKSLSQSKTHCYILCFSFVFCFFFKMGMAIFLLCYCNIYVSCTICITDSIAFQVGQKQESVGSRMPNVPPGLFFRHAGHRYKSVYLLWMCALLYIREEICTGLFCNFWSQLLLVYWGDNVLPCFL